ncbi:MAG: hypothetical protein LQ346_009116, partial [Caloplaca aetnensis]
MHELLLYALVPTARHAQVLSILAGIAAMEPQQFHEQHMIYKPTRPATRAVKPVGGSQTLQSSNPTQAPQGDLYYLHFVEDLVEKRRGEADDTGEEEKPDGDVVMGEGQNEGEEINGMPEVRPIPYSEFIDQFAH